MPGVAISLETLEGLSEAMRDAPKTMLQNLAKAFGEIGRYDITKFRGSLAGKFNIRAKGLANSFKSKATDPAKATSFDKLFTSEYTGWKAAQIFQTGGKITGKGKNLTILFPAARSAGGKRKFSQSQLRAMVASGEVRFVPTPRGVLIIQSKGGLTKKGNPRKGTRDIILGILKRSVTEKKRLDFFENAQGNSSMHQDILETAVENTLVEIASKK